MKKTVIGMVMLAASLMAVPVFAAETEKTAVVEESGQNPVMNYIGDYGYFRATMHVEADGMEGAKGPPSDHAAQEGKHGSVVRVGDLLPVRYPHPRRDGRVGVKRQKRPGQPADAKNTQKNRKKSQKISKRACIAENSVV